MGLELDRFLDLYFEESLEYLGVLDRVQVLCEEEGAHDVPVREFRRAAHSIKSASAAFGFDDAVMLAELIENYFDSCMKHPELIQTFNVRTIQEGCQILRGCIDERHNSKISTGVDSTVLVMCSRIRKVLAS